MAQIDLEPHEYAQRDRKTGRLRRDMSPRWYRNWFLVSLLPLGFIIWHHAEMGDKAFFPAITFAALSGMGLHGWLRYVP